MECPRCKNRMIKLVPLDGIIRPITIVRCNCCGYEMAINNKAGNKFIDVIAVFSLAFSAITITFISIVFYVVPLFWLIFYGLWYMIAKDKRKDVSDLKKSFYSIFIFFFVSFGIVIIF